MNPNVAAHKMVREVALGIAAEAYGEAMKDNKWYAKWKATHPGMNIEQLQKEWCRLAWPSFIKVARATLAKMLTEDRPENLKAEIHDALIKDSHLRAAEIHTRVLH